jgi:phosphocarrier protein
MRVDMLEKKVIVQHKVGLHARPAARFAQLSKQFESSIFVSCHNRKADAKSLLGLLSLGVSSGDEISIRTDGIDQLDALRTLELLVLENFGEEHI